MKKIAVIVAGGSGTRMKSAIPKQFLLLKNKPILWHTIAAFTRAFSDMEIIMVLPASCFEEGRNIAASFTDTHKINIVQGGETRFHSVKNGLHLIKEEAIVFVHDGVRCLVSESLIRSCYQQASEKGSAIPAIAATDSVRIIEGQKNKSINRENIRIIQTPQTFISSLLLPAFDQNYRDSFTDEASVVETYGKEVFLIQGEEGNIKITKPIDLILAENILAERK
ncbi:2-C-methyl-D-erythritol 4-phosphate cytidylyltransferase [Arachidicoccus sp.]|uniref:2-C-methyl-D-erythritol 4-phosphate cytidylyltransferase n=1 Tax=Arachidicoccus sp. TaxID=1872624 RepID=UPI003D20411E